MRATIAMKLARVALALGLSLMGVRAAHAVPTTTTVRLPVNPVVEGLIMYVSVDVAPMSSYVGRVELYVDDTLFTSALVYPDMSFAVTGVAVGTHQVSARFLGGGGFDPSTSPPVSFTILEYAPHAQYFAEGATGSFFQTDIGVLNVNATTTATVTATFYLEAGPPIVRTFTLPPLTRRTIDVNAAVGSQQGVATLMNADAGIAATRQMRWGSPVYGSTFESGVRAPSTSWYFAEGATGYFSLFYMLFNPNDQPATVTMTHLREGGGTPVVDVTTVPPFSRRTVYVNGIPALAQGAFATVVTSDQPIAAERAMYVNDAGQVFAGGTVGGGATALSNHWEFAEGGTGFFRTYLLIGNPHTQDTTANVRYQLPDGTILYKSHPVPAQARLTIDVGEEDPRLASTPVAFAVDGAPAFVAERSMWWGLPFTEGATALGTDVDDPFGRPRGKDWGIGEAAEGGPDDDATFVVIENRFLNEGRVRLTIVYDDATTEQKDYDLRPDNRISVRVREAFPNTLGKRFSIVVESLDRVPIVVECARFQSSAAFIGAGGVASATRIR